MKYNLQLLQILYSSASAKYLKLRVRLDKARLNGRFRKLSKRKQYSLLTRLKRLYDKLKSLQTQLRLAGAGAAFALTLSVSSPVQSQSALGPFERTDAANPLPPPIIVRGAQPAVVDIDDDGDLDLFVGNRYGNIEFFRNDSPPDSVTKFIEVSGPANPFDGVYNGRFAAPAFIDADNDGDFDVLMGNYYGFTFYYENTGSETNPVFTERTGGSNPFDGIQGTATGMGYGPPRAIPTFVDLDTDGDQDLVLGSSYVNADGTPMGGIKYYKNTAGTFEEYSIPLLGALFYAEKATTTFADVDGDGDLDLFAGEGYSSVQFFKQGVEGVFDPSYGTWDPVLKTGNPFAAFGFSKYAKPVAADFDGDGDLDFIVATYHSNCFNCIEQTNLRYFENTDGDFSLEEMTGLNTSPTGGVDVRNSAYPVFTDIDGDSDVDAILGSKYTNPDVHIYVNNNGKFVQDLEHPLIEIIDDVNPSGVHRDVTPVFVDIDGDNDRDIFVTTGSHVAFLRNNGGTFENEGNSLFGFTPSNAWGLSLAFIDVDTDGDLDAIFGNAEYSAPRVAYFENTGSATSPTFTPATPPAPFDNPSTFENSPLITGVDLDHDGDIDIIANEFYNAGGYTYYNRAILFVNNGDETFTKTDPMVTQLYSSGITSFMDADGDGDLDAFRGDYNGTVIFFENTNPAPETEVSTSSRTISGGLAAVIDPDITINDSDSDDIVLALVSISDFVAGSETLGFDESMAAEFGITGEFDDDEGVLTLSGRSIADHYQALLRTVTLNFSGNVPNGRVSKAKSTLDLAQNITFQVRDTDFTLTTISIVSINIIPGSEIIVFNAISPGKDDTKNAFFNIANIQSVSPENKVTIYNRWGDVVFEMKNYDNTIANKRFEGVSDNGKDLPGGTYFYKIETTDKTLTGYLSLKR